MNIAEEIVKAHEKNKDFIIGTKTPPYIKFNTIKDITITTIKNPKINNMEQNCLVIQNWTKRTNLNHQERTYLMMIYARLEQQGIHRLKEIMSQQENYSQKITDNNINTYLRQGKFYGVSCQKLKEQGYCKKECEKIEDKTTS